MFRTLALRRPSWLRRMLSSHQELVAGEREQEAVGAGATPIRDLQPHTMGTVQGTVSMLTLNPRSGSAWLEAELHDGTGTDAITLEGGPFLRTLSELVAGAITGAPGVPGADRGSGRLEGHADVQPALIVHLGRVDAVDDLDEVLCCLDHCAHPHPMASACGSCFGGL